MTKNQEDLELEELIRRQLGPIRITKEAYEKANCIAKRICKLADKSLEVYFYAVNNMEKQKEGDIAIRDIYIAQEQEVNGVRCVVGVEGQYLSKEDIVTNLEGRIIGWAHSHGDMGSFHSSTDDGNIYSTLRKFGFDIDMEVKNRTVININNQQNEEFSLGDRSYYLESMTLVEVCKKPVRITYSLVFNAQNSKPFCVVAYQAGDKKDMIEDYDLEIIDEDNGIETDKKVIDQQLVQRVKNLRERLANAGEDIEKNYSSFQKDYVEFNKNYSALTKYLKETDKYENIYTESKLIFKTLKYFLKLIEIKDKYEDSYLPCLTDNLEKLLGYISDTADDIFKRLSEDKVLLEKRQTKIKQDIEEIPENWLSGRKVKLLNKLSDAYETLLRPLCSYEEEKNENTTR